MKKKMLVVVDYQKDFVDGSLGFAGAESLDEGIAVKVRESMERGGYVVVTMDTHHKDYLETREGKALPVPHCIEGTPGWELFGQTKEALAGADCIMLKKGTFGVDPHDMITLPDNVSEIEMVGLVTNLCVLSNVCCFQARYPDAQITVDLDLCGGADKSLHRTAGDIMRSQFIRVLHDPWPDRAV